MEGAPARRPPLQIVLDLDLTLLQATVALPDDTSRQQPNARQLHSFVLRGPNRVEANYVLGLRDGLNEFLRQLKQLATIHVYTMGSKSYCSEVIEIIDPGKDLIEGRVRKLPSGGSPWRRAQPGPSCGPLQVMCRKDSAGESFTKSLTHIFDSKDDERLACALVMDDRIDAWDEPSRDKLIQAAFPVEPVGDGPSHPRTEPSRPPTEYGRRRSRPSGALARTGARCRSLRTPT